MNKQKMLIIDGDSLAYRAAAAVQHIQEDEFGIVQPFARVVEGQAVVENLLFSLIESFGGDEEVDFAVYLSDPEANFRSTLYPDYKKQRSETPRPLLLGNLKQYLRDSYEAEHWPGLEADDVLGILATQPDAGIRIMCGDDKDYLTVPAPYHRFGDTEDNGRARWKSTSVVEADRFLLIQTLAGDKVDNYPGCPGLGMDRAAEAIDNPAILIPGETKITRGPRKGEAVTKWTRSPTDDLWACVVSHYERAGLGETEALLTARLARILRWEDFDYETGRITLWTPDKLGGYTREYSVSS